MPLGGDGREEAGVNDSPVGCQSRLTEAASSRKKEPYRPHQAKSELVARLEVISNGVIFFMYPEFCAKFRIHKKNHPIRDDFQPGD